VCPWILGPHMIVYPHRRWELTCQSGRTFIHEIYGSMNTFHHRNSKVLASDVQPFLLEIFFGPSKFVSEQGQSLDEGGWELVGLEEWSLPQF
jgi:hypothetical protein